MFKNLGEEVFDDYWMNYNKITILDQAGKNKNIRALAEFLEYRGVDRSLINPRTRKISAPKSKYKTATFPGMEKDQDGN